jgi:shikimate dehydrogenase
MDVSGETRVCGIIGDPVTNTLSPVMHNTAFAKLKLNFVYVPFRVRRHELRKALVGSRSLGIVGLNVTMPHKTLVLRYLDEIEPTAKLVGAVNTILNDERELKGYNTDGIGALRALKENGISLEGRRMLLLGAGGAARSIAFSAAEKTEKLWVLNRTANKAKELAQTLRKTFGNNVGSSPLSAKNLRDKLEDADIIVNATSVGMSPKTHESLVPANLLRKESCVMDIVYCPMETRLLREAKAAGAKTVSGIDMLVFQGASSFEIWTNHSAPIKVMKQAVMNSLRGRAPIERDG